ncbi:hypothetical protein chiPu_0028167 [Chiloscyllium punctatum]|uniref:Uncharacterized protein n=1 Tax=Chiloscyllium punctatum TaxID=137246 RepID=A0A401TNJ7_CHIPU|nr:hypothetical protein [Chiloscyllium punctatum]
MFGDLAPQGLVTSSLKRALRNLVRSVSLSPCRFRVPLDDPPSLSLPRALGRGGKRRERQESVRLAEEHVRGERPRGMLGTGEEGEPGGLEGGRRSIDSTHRREPGGQNGEGDHS